MAILNAPTLQNTMYSGDCPLATAHGSITLASAAIADVVRLVKLFAGTKIVDLHMVAADMGTDTTISIGYEYVNGESGGSATALLAATDVATGASSTRMSVKPVTLAHDAYITATIAGGTATGALDVIVTYEFVGK